MSYSNPLHRMFATQCGLCLGFHGPRDTCPVVEIEETREAEAEMKALSERITQMLCSVDGGTPTVRDLNRLEALENRLGYGWDAVNGTWTEVETTD